MIRIIIIIIFVFYLLKRYNIFKNRYFDYQWNHHPNYKKLKLFQKENKKKLRNTIYFFLRPSDRKTDLKKINIKIPTTFKAILKEENISLCKVKIGGFDTRTKCLEDIPADIEINGALNIFPYSPIPYNKESYAIVLKVINPRKSGLYQFHSFGQPKGKSVSSYLGAYTIVIDWLYNNIFEDINNSFNIIYLYYLLEFDYVLDCF